jgi:hypothetical protein
MYIYINWGVKCNSDNFLKKSLNKCDFRNSIYFLKNKKIIQSHILRILKMFYLFMLHVYIREKDDDVGWMYKNL